MTDSPQASALAAEWDERYRSLADQIPDGEPSRVLIDEIGRHTPGTALEIGCGTGADAVWLAENGWTVTALDVSQVILDRAEARGRSAGVHVDWRHTPLEDLTMPPGGYDLVTAHYPALRHSDDGAAGRALLGAVGAAGTLLVVHHADLDAELARSHGFELSDYIGHDDTVALLDQGWEVTVDRRRPRPAPAGLSGQHTHDDIIVARRLRA